MSPLPAPPWSQTVRLNEIGQGLTRELSADEPARARIAKALELQALDRLEATVSVTPSGADWRVDGRFSADVTQTCGVTLEPLPASLSGAFQVRLSESPEEEPRLEDLSLDLSADDPADLIEGGTIDLASYVVEHLALELDPFPRKPGAVFEPPPTEAEPSPFAKLAALKPRDGA